MKLGPVEDSLREPGGGGGFFPTGGGGPLFGKLGAEDSGLGTVVRARLRRFGWDGWNVGVLGLPGSDGRPGIEGAMPGGGLGAPKRGGWGTDLDSGSDRYDESRFAGQSVSGERTPMGDARTTTYLPCRRLLRFSAA